ncbi:MAG: N-acyl homoserine lactonase family protein [Archaeoglobaceae archaeon]|nr:N-acyl homoserine lactonase family protein [Archaeoglobaceae archaeon]MDW8128430.1 N-acyl homoserine lactonase family protein [Archaeoglobaceae archaeon]
MFQIKPLKQAEVKVPLGVVAMLADMRYIVSGPVYVWLISDGEKKILVDAGVKGNNSTEGVESLRNALSREKVKPEEIEILILTHLHFDHVSYAKLFENARIFVQREEWRSALNPPPHYRGIYIPELFLPLEDMDLCLVRGDKEIEEGISLISLPGHTKGSQGVLVEAESGKYLLSGDQFYSYINLFPKRIRELRDEEGNKLILNLNIPFHPPGFHLDLSDWFESCFKAMSLVKKGRILPGHEPSLEGKEFK